MKQQQLFFGSLFIVLLLVYFPSLNNGFTFLDDQVQVVENPAIVSLDFKHLKQIFSSTSVGMYQPLTTLIYGLIYGAFELNPLGYHLFSLLFHAFNCILVFRFLKSFLEESKLLYFLVAVFALHPMQVESISWVSAFSNLVYSSFYLLGLLTYQNFKKKGSRKFYLLTLLYFVLSCFSKSTAVTFPVLMLVLDFYERRDWKKVNWLGTLPFFIISFVFGLVTLYSRESAGHLSDLSIQFSEFDRLFLLSYSVLFYPLKFLFPLQLSAFYPYPDLVDGTLPIPYYASILVVGIIGFGLLKLKEQKQILLGVFFFLITIALVLHFIPVGNQLTTDRYVYLPCIGFLMVVGKLLEPLKGKIVLNLLFLLPLLLAFKSHQSSKLWANDGLIWENVIEQYPNVAQAYNNLGSYILESGQIDLALQHYNKAIALKPYYADAYSNRGNLLAQKGDAKSAIRDYSKAIELRPHADAYFNRGNELSKLNDLNSAIADYSKSLALKQSADAYTSRAYAYVKQGQVVKAKEDLALSIQLSSNYDPAYFLLGLIFQQEGNRAKACENFSTAQRLGNENARGIFQQYCGIK